ncbi:MAG: type II toxin-antitoxin system VapC family toxin [Gammaproteobacteria bacterium]|nr:type II toxin-antitoxin system VapC family toxin [Gammaproteobacteria bacterium]
MSFLIDTNVICEFSRPQPNSNVVAWFRQVANEKLFISVITIGEIRNGIEKLAASKRQEKLRMWLEQDLVAWFNDRILTIDYSVADRWGRLLNENKRSMPAIDSLIAATALHYDLQLVTRNCKDFAIPGLTIINPWI